MLTNKQIKFLRTQAHTLAVVLQTGSNGLTDAVQDEIAVALAAHELIKIKLNAERDLREQHIQQLLRAQRCELVQYIGKTVVLFKPNPQQRKIALPQG